jgi:hypothetical protein
MEKRAALNERLGRAGALLSGVFGLMLLGIVWFVQVIQYPLFSEVGAEQFQQYESAYTQRAGWLIAPLMLLELAACFIWVFWANRSSRMSMMLSLLALIGIWLSTFFVQVPLHTQLQQGWDSNTANELITSNWMRVILWTVKAIVWIRLVVICPGIFFQKPRLESVAHDPTG